MANVAASEWLGRVRGEPWRYGFFALLRRLSAVWKHMPPLGQARRPQQEPLRLGQAASLVFAPREIAEAVLPVEPPACRPPGQPRPRAGNNPRRPTVRVFGLGMLGPNGALPLHYTELIRERTETHHDPTLADFLDLFHHRYLTHMYRAWAQAQAAAGLDRRQDERFSRYIAHLGGHDPIEIRDGPLPDHARLSASTWLSADARHPDGLSATVARYFGVPVQVNEFVMHWIEIEPEDHTRLGLSRASSILGDGAILGELVPDRQSRFRLILGPLSLTKYLQFTPQGEELRVLIEWVRAFVGLEFSWELELRVNRNDTPPVRLEDRHRLGWSTWLGESTHDPRHVGFTVGLVFEPERYMATHSSAHRQP